MARATLLMVLVGGLAQAETPRLLFTRADLPHLRARLTVPPTATIWQAIRERAETMVDPASSGFARPETLAVATQNLDRPQVIAHEYGRRLTAYMEHLGFAWQMTGDAKYARHGALLLETAARELPVSRPDIAKSFAGARGDLVRGFTLGHDWLGDALTDAQRAAVEACLAEYLRNLLAEAGQEKMWFVPAHNFVGVGIGASGLAALALRDRYPAEAPGWIDACARHVTNWYEHGFDADGAYYEGTSYGFYGLGNSTLFADALLRATGRNLFEHPHLRRVTDFYALSLLPGERVFDARNDANYSGGDATLLRLASAYQSGLAQWLMQAAGEGASPLRIIWANEVAPVDPVAAKVPLDHWFRGRGLVVHRTGWTRDDVMFSTEAGPFVRVTHNQADKGHFTLYGLGRRWAIDTGYGNNRIPDGPAQTVAHNAVLIDGKGQALSGAGTGTDGRIADYAAEPRYGYGLVDAADAYRRNSSNQPGVAVQRALRHHLFVRPSHGAAAYAVILDDLRADDTEHEYTWLLHTAPEMLTRRTAPGELTLTPPPVPGAWVDTPVDATAPGTAEWTVNVPEAGEYVLFGRVRAVPPELAKTDSFRVTVAGRTVDWHMPGRADWTWGRVASGVPPTPVTFALPAGRTSIRFGTREPGAQVAELALAREGWQPGTGEAPVALLAASQATLTAPMRLVTQETEPLPRCRVWVAAAAPITSDPVAPYAGHPRWMVSTRAVEPRFAAVLVPLPAATPDPRVTVQSTAAGVAIDIAWAGRRDTIRWQPGERPVVTLTP